MERREQAQISANDPNTITDASGDLLDGTGVTYGNAKNYVTFEGLSDLSGGTAGILMTYASLPVELIRFTAQENDCNVLLGWVSGSEENFSHYEIERSTDGRTFEKVDDVYGQGGTSIQASYSFEDTDAGETNYYRLKMIDLDATYEYSDIVLVDLGCKEKHDMKLYPNPVLMGSTMTVEFYASTEEAKIVIHDISGKVVRVMAIGVEKGWNKMRLNRTGLSNGTYFLSNTSEQGKIPMKFIMTGIDG